ncbi:MAG: DUF6502 family protein [Steroidobacteraceae bacterium]
MQLLLPIARLLVTGGTGIDKLIQAAKRAYLRAAVEAILPSSQRVNISRLSVATGMTRKEVSFLLKDSNFDRNTATKKRPGEQRALRVLRGWMTDPRFQNRSGHADTLRYGGHAKSFVQLVKLYGGDVTPKSVQRELERMCLVELTGAGALRLRRARKRSTLEAYHLSDLARLFEDFAFSITRPKPNSEAPSFFGFRDYTVSSASDAAFFMSRFSRRAAALLEDFQDWSIGRGPPNTSSKNDLPRVGLGVYLLRSDSGLAPDAVADSRDRTAHRRGSKPRRRLRS